MVTKLNMKNTKAVLKTVAASLIPFVIVACSSGATQSALVTTSGTTTDGTTTLASTTAGSTTSGTLFDTTTANDATPTTTATTTNTVSATESACLSGGFGTLNNGTTASTSQLQCLSTAAATNGFGQSTLYNAATGTFNALNYCIQQVAALAPATGSSQTVVAQAFKVAAAAEVRCIRQILQSQMQYPLSQNLLSGLGSNDAILYQMLGSYLNGTTTTH